MVGDGALGRSEDGGKEAILVKVGELLIDEGTGEVLEWPSEKRGDRIEYLTHLCLEAQQAAKLWEQAYNAYRAALAKLLNDHGVQSMRTVHGTPAIRSRSDRRGRPERVESVVHRYELSREQAASIWMCASALDPKRIDALAEAGAIPAEAAADLIEVKSTSWVQVTAARPAPPTVERGALPPATPALNR